jgi:hypothetical protein
MKLVAEPTGLFNEYGNVVVGVRGARRRAPASHTGRPVRAGSGRGLPESGSGSGRPLGLGAYCFSFNTDRPGMMILPLKRQSFSPLFSSQRRHAIHTDRRRRPGAGSAGITSAEPPVRLAGPGICAVRPGDLVAIDLGQPQHARRRIAVGETVIARDPAPPKAWITRSMTPQALLGGTTLIIAIAARTALLPSLSIIEAAFRVNSRACSIMMRADL